MLLGAESCAPDIGLTRDKAQRCSGPVEEINSAALAAEPSQHTYQMGQYEGIHLYHPGSPVLLSEKSVFIAFLPSELF